MKMIIIFNHSLNEEQRVAAQSQFGVTEFIELTPELKPVWGQVPAEPESISNHIEPVVKWALDQEPEVALVQGDFGATYEVVTRLKEKGVMVVYATTKRESVETTNPQGEVVKTSVFKHVRFREF